MRAATTLALALALGLLLADESDGQDKPPANPVLTVFQLDANGDMTLERDEVPEAGHAAFDRLLKLGDANKNGKLEPEEMRAMAQKVQTLAVAGAARFKAMDKDGDGKLSKDEFEGPKPLFPQIDADKDGFISQQEATRFVAAGGGNLQQRLQAMDKNGDSKVSEEEFTGPRPLFARLDTDKDGFVTKEEAAKLPALGTNASANAKPRAEEPKQKKPVPENAGGGKRIKAMDKDGDGKVSRAEFTGPPRLFDRLDVNHDGVLGVDDLLNRRPAGKAQGKKAPKP